MPQLSPDVRTQIQTLNSIGWSPYMIIKEIKRTKNIKVSISTVRRWSRRNLGVVQNQKYNCGRPKLFNNFTKTNIIKDIKVSGTSLRELGLIFFLEYFFCLKLSFSGLKYRCSHMTIKNVIGSSKMFPYKTRKRIVLSSAQKAIRKKWCTKHIRLRSNFKKITYFDEKPFQLFKVGNIQNTRLLIHSSYFTFFTKFTILFLTLKPIFIPTKLFNLFVKLKSENLQRHTLSKVLMLF